VRIGKKEVTVKVRQNICLCLRYQGEGEEIRAHVISDSTTSTGEALPVHVRPSAHLDAVMK
jgi:hypothetical protein